MGLLSGMVAVSRFTVSACPEEPDFAGQAFRALPPGSERRESVGLVPFEPGADYRVGQNRFAFRVRIDRLRPDPTAVRERFADLLARELAGSGLRFLAAKRRRELREQAIEEICRVSAPTTKIVEGCLDGAVLYLGTTARTLLGTCLVLLRQIGIVADPKAPWLDAGEDEPTHPFLEIKEPGHSVWGPRFLRALVEEGELLVEPLAGAARLQTRDAKIALSGVVVPELVRFLEEGAEILALRLVAGELRFRLEALPYRLVGLGLERSQHEHWSEQLDERLERTAELFALLDERFAALRDGIVAGFAPASG